MTVRRVSDNAVVLSGGSSAAILNVAPSLTKPADQSINPDTQPAGQCGW